MKKLLLIILLLGFVFFFASSSQSLVMRSDHSNFCNIIWEKGNFYAASANCSEWSIQPNGCYERVCCCDSSGKHYCERCCPDKDGKCIASKVNC